MKEGTIIQVKDAGVSLFNHYGVIVGSEGGQQYVFHNTPIYGASVDEVEVFLSSRGQPTAVLETELNSLDTNELVARFEKCDRYSNSGFFRFLKTYSLRLSQFQYGAIKSCTYWWQ